VAKSDYERQTIRLDEAHEHRRCIDRVKAKVKRGQPLRIDGRKGKVVDVYDDFIVVEFTVFCLLWSVRYDKYRECFFWSEVAGLL